MESSSLYGGGDNHGQYGGNHGLGRCRNSYLKFDQIKKYMYRPLPVLSKRGRGCIIDMHAGDGKETPHPIPDLFCDGSPETTPTLAIHAARRYPSDVILCEKDRRRRAGLQNAFGHVAKVIGDHKELLKLEEQIKAYPWILVLNDPNGHKDQGVDVLQWLSRMVPCSDFIIVVNIHGIKCCLGVKDRVRPGSITSYQSGVDNQWMLSDESWKSKLGKRQILNSGTLEIGPRMHANILLASNFIPGYGR